MGSSNGSSAVSASECGSQHVFLTFEDARRGLSVAAVVENQERSASGIGAPKQFNIGRNNQRWLDFRDYSSRPDRQPPPAPHSGSGACPAAIWYLRIWVLLRREGWLINGSASDDCITWMGYSCACGCGAETSFCIVGGPESNRAD